MFVCVETWLEVLIVEIFTGVREGKQVNVSTMARLSADIQAQRVERCSMFWRRMSVWHVIIPPGHE